MKVFTVGMDEKPPLKEGDTKSPEVLPAAPLPTPLVAIESRRRRSSGLRALAIALFTLFCLLFLGIIVSELAYNRARDENYLRLRWAELKQRLGYGYDPLDRFAMHLQGLQGNSLPKPVEVHLMQPVPIVPETTVPVETNNSKDDKETVTEENNAQSEPRLNFLRTLLETIRDHAAKNGIDGTMEVSVVQVDPIAQIQHIRRPSFLDGANRVGGLVPIHINSEQGGFSPFSQSIQDGFGETHVQPGQVMFGPWPSDDYYTMEENNEFNGQKTFRQHGHGQQEQGGEQQIIIQPPQQPFGHQFRPTWRGMNGEEMNNEINEEQRPMMRVTHHFDGSRRPDCFNCPPWLVQQQQPNRVVTEVYGDRFKHLLQELIARRLGTVIGGIGGGMQNEEQQQDQMMPVMAEIPMVQHIRPVMLDNLDHRMQNAIQQQQFRPQEPWMNQNQPWGNNNNEIEMNNVMPMVQQQQQQPFFQHQGPSFQFPRPIVITHVQQQQEQQQPPMIGMGAQPQQVQIIHQQQEPIVIAQPVPQEAPKIESFFNNVIGNVAKEWPTEEWKPWTHSVVDEPPTNNNNNNFWHQPPQAMQPPMVETVRDSNQQPVDEQHSALHLLPLRELQAPPSTSEIHQPDVQQQPQQVIDEVPHQPEEQPVSVGEVPHQPESGSPLNEPTVVVTQEVPGAMVEHQQPEQVMPVIGGGETGENEDLAQQQPQMAVIDNEPPPTIDFPAVKFPTVDGVEQQQHPEQSPLPQHHDSETAPSLDEAAPHPLFLQVDEPQPQTAVVGAADPPPVAAAAQK